MAALASTNVSLFAPDGEVSLGSDRQATVVDAIRTFFEQRKPWSETTPPHFESKAVRIISPDVALVHASETVHGSVILRRSTPAMLVLKRESGQ